MIVLLGSILNMFTSINHLCNAVASNDYFIKYHNDMVAAYKSILINYVEEGVDSLERNPKFIQFIYGSFAL